MRISQVIHEAGIIHRDLKTSNFMFGNATSSNAFISRIVHILDFGLARYRNPTVPHPQIQ